MKHFFNIKWMLEVKKRIDRIELFWNISIDIYGIWFISKNDCPRVTECLKR